MARSPLTSKLWMLAVLLPACGGEVGQAPEALARHDRFGILRDLVLIPRPDARGGPYFLDRFETSRRDLQTFLAATGRAAPAAWLGVWKRGVDDEDMDTLEPAVRVDLELARRFAQWRLCRLPTFDEWDYAATASGTYRYPWGDHGRAEWANTPELGLGRSVPVGTFESGRSPAGPYELVGNVAEWTESLRDESLAVLAATSRVGWGSAVWSLPGQPRPLLDLLAGAAAPVPRLVVGGAFVGLSGGTSSHRSPQGTVPVLECCPREWSDTTGIRLAADARGLLEALAREPELPAPAEREWQAFVARPRHRALLTQALPAARLADGPVASSLRRTLQR